MRDPKDIRIIETDPSGETHEASGLTFGENEILPLWSQFSGTNLYLNLHVQSRVIPFWTARGRGLQMGCGRTSSTDTTHNINFFLKFSKSSHLRKVHFSAMLIQIKFLRIQFCID